MNVILLETDIIELTVLSRPSAYSTGVYLVTEYPLPIIHIEGKGRLLPHNRSLSSHFIFFPKHLLFFQPPEEEEVTLYTPAEACRVAGAP